MGDWPYKGTLLRACILYQCIANDPEAWKLKTVPVYHLTASEGQESRNTSGGLCLGIPLAPKLQSRCHPGLGAYPGLIWGELPFPAHSRRLAGFGALSAIGLRASGGDWLLAGGHPQFFMMWASQHSHLLHHNHKRRVCQQDGSTIFYASHRRDAPYPLLYSVG